MSLADNVLNLAKGLFAGLTGSTASPDDRGAAVFQEVLKVVDQTASTREKIQKYRDFYNGDQVTGTGLNKGTTYVPQWPDEDDDDFDTRVERMASKVWNRIRDGVDTHVDGLYAWGKGRAVSREINWERASVPQSVEAFFDDYYAKFLESNKFALRAWDIWADVGSEGWSLQMLRWMDGSGRRPKRFASGTTRSEMRDRGVVWVELLDNLRTVPLPHPDQTTELGAVIRWYIDADDETVDAGDKPFPGDRNTITELITDTLWLRWKGRELTQHSWGVENRYGDVRTMFVWARNPGLIPDSDGATGPQAMLNERIYTGSEIERNHAFPETLYKGFEPPTRTRDDGSKELVRGVNIAYVSEDPKADIVKRTPETTVQDVGVAISDVHQMLNEALSQTDLDRGIGSSAGQMRSAPALNRMQAKSERRRRRKVLFADAWEQDMFRAVAMMTAYHALGYQPGVDGELRTLLPVKLDVTFPDDAFQMDPFTEAQKDALEVERGIDTQEAKLRKRHPDASDEDIGRMLAEIERTRQDSQGGGAQGRSADPTPQERSQAQG